MISTRRHDIDVPVLLTQQSHDTIRPSIVKTMEGWRVNLIGEQVLLPHSGHISIIDDAVNMNDEMVDFVLRVEWVPDQEGAEMDTFVPY